MSTTEYGLDPRQFLRHVVIPALWRIGLDSLAAQVLVLGTALVESRLRWLDQIDKYAKPGPAYGLYQMELATHDDIWANYLSQKIAIRLAVARLSVYSSLGDKPDATELWSNLAYATAMCRVHYRRVSAPLPRSSDAHGMAFYHKRFYNTDAGATIVEHSLKHFEFAARLIAENK
jgi:hypothetical protein